MKNSRYIVGISAQAGMMLWPILLITIAMLCFFSIFSWTIAQTANVAQSLPSNALSTAQPLYLGQYAQIDWSAGIVQVRGVGLFPTGVSEAQARLQAVGAARADALRIIASVASQITITQERQVASYRVNLEAFLQRVRFAEATFSHYDGKAIAQIEAQIPLFGVNSLAAHILPRERQFAPTPIPLASVVQVNPQSQITGLIINAHSATVVPSINIVMVDEAGTVIYSAKSLPDVANGMHRYHSTLEAAQSNYELVGTNPLIITPRAIYGNVIHIRSSDAQRILNAVSVHNFLSMGRVAVVAQNN